jgi:hypothetical protein
MGVPLALHVLAGDAGERVIYGDTEVPLFSRGI